MLVAEACVGWAHGYGWMPEDPERSANGFRGEYAAWQPRSLGLVDPVGLEGLEDGPDDPLQRVAHPVDPLLSSEAN